MSRTRYQRTITIEGCQFFEKGEVLRTNRAAGGERPQDIKQQSVNMLVRYRGEDVGSAELITELFFQRGDLDRHLCQFFPNGLSRAGGA